MISATFGKDVSPKSLTIEVTRVASGGEIELALRNESSKALRIWREENSWGAARWRVLRVRRGELMVFFQSTTKVFTVNVPSSRELEVGNRLSIALDINESGWQGTDAIGGKLFAPGDLVVVIYDVPWSPEASSTNVWFGVAAGAKTLD